MIQILHGEDSKSSYAKLNFLTQNFPTHRKITLSGRDTSRDEFLNSLTSQSLFEEKELIIGQNLIKNKIAQAADINKLSKEKEIILWEDTELTNLQLSKFKKDANIEIFKLPTQLYIFLDSIAPGSGQTFRNLQKLKTEKKESLCWQLSNRFFLLVLAKRGTDYTEASELNLKINRSRLFDWQWQKIKNQAYPFDINTLKALLAGTLKIDFMLKSGATNMDEITLINILLLKYLRPQINATISSTAHGRYSQLY